MATFGLNLGNLVLTTRLDTQSLANGLLKTQPLRQLPNPFGLSPPSQQSRVQLVETPLLSQQSSPSPLDKIKNKNPAIKLGLGVGSIVEMREGFKPIIKIDQPEPKSIKIASPPIIIIPPIRASKSPKEHYPKDYLSVKEKIIKNRNFVENSNRSICVDRPEIISILNYEPIFVGDPKQRQFSSLGRLVEIQHQGAYLRRDLLQEVLLDMSIISKLSTKQKKIKTIESANIFETLKQKSGKYAQDVQQTISLLGRITDKIDLIESFFDLKRIPSDVFETNQFLSLKEYFIERMGFREEQFNSFSDTKIFYQFLADLRSVIENYSFNLLDLTDDDRKTDSSPVKIDTTYTLTDGFSFNVKQIRSTSSRDINNATQSVFFNKFMNSMPSNPVDRIKILLTILSKEYRISKVLGSPNQRIQKILSTEFDYEGTGNPFDNLLGTVGRTIFDQPAGEESLANLGQIAVKGGMQDAGGVQNFVVLPLEAKYVDSDEDNIRTFVPGKSYFVDSILDLKTTKQSNGKEILSFNTNPLQEYADLFSKKHSHAELVIDELLDLRSATDLDPERMFDTFARSIRESVLGLKEKNKISMEQGIISAIFKLANQNNELKQLLFQFLILAGLQTNRQHHEQVIWAEVAKELKDISAFSAINTEKIKQTAVRNALPPLATSLITGGPEEALNIGPYMRQIAQQIHDLVFREMNAYKEPIKSSNIIVKTIEKNKGTLVEYLLGATKVNSSSNFIKEFIEMADFITDIASTEGEKLYLLDDGSGRTRYNFLSTTTQLLIIYEIFCSFIARYIPIRFVTTKKGQRPPKIISNQKRVKNLSVVPTVGIQINVKNIERITNAFGIGVSLNESQIPKPSAIDDSELKSGNLKLNVKKVKKPAVQIKSSIQQKEDVIRDNYKIINPSINNFFESKEDLNIPLDEQIHDKATFLLRRNLISIRDKIRTEDLIIANATYLLKILGNRLQQAREAADAVFNEETFSYLSQMMSRTGSDDVLRERFFMIRNRPQIRTSTYLSDTFWNRVNNVAQFKNQENLGILYGEREDVIITTELIHNQVKEACYSYLSEKDFQERDFISGRIKIMSVGIPNGFTKKLIDRVDFSSIKPNSFKEKQNDVIVLNVWKRDLKREDFIFKPQKFVFDLSLFQREQELIEGNVEPNKPFWRFLQNNRLVDYEKTQEKSFYTIERGGKNSKCILDDERYNFLSDDEKRQLFSNHTSSFLLETFLNLSTGLKINEGTYSIRDIETSQEIEKEFERFFISYIEQTLQIKLPEGKGIKALLEDKNTNDEVVEYLRMIDTGGLVFSLEKINKNILEPKLFDRVFHVAINSDNFEIDFDEMQKWESSKKALNQSSLRKQIITKKKGTQVEYYFKPKSKEDIIFEDYFITIESTI